VVVNRLHGPGTRRRRPLTGGRAAGGQPATAPGCGPAAEYQDRAGTAFAALTGRRDPALENLLAGAD